MGSIARRVAAGLSPLMAGVAVELLLVLGKNEPASIGRLLGFLAVSLAIFGVVSLAGRSRISLRALVNGVITAVGLVVLGSGLVLVLAGSATNPAWDALGVLLIGTGTAVPIVGLHLGRLLDQVDPKLPSGRTGRTVEAPSTLPISVTTFDLPVPREVQRLCCESLDIDGLHYVAYYEDGECRLSVDLFNEHVAELMFTGTELRRGEYEAAGRYLSGLVDTLTIRLGGLRQGQVHRLVVDVTRGAIFYHSIDERRCLVGVTLNQNLGDLPEIALTDLATELAIRSGFRR